MAVLVLPVQVCKAKDLVLPGNCVGVQKAGGPGMTELEREHLILLIANDLASLLCREPAQSEAFEALMAELERASVRELVTLRAQQILKAETSTNSSAAAPA